MARLGESAGNETGRIFFELDQFQLAGEHRIEIRGRWFGVRGRRFVRPTLMLQADGARHRALADLEHKPWLAEDGEPWEASFPWHADGAEVRGAELAVAPDIAIPLPAPNSRRRSPTRLPVRRGEHPRPHAAPERDELAEARQEIARLRSELEASNEARLESHGERDRALGERDDARRQLDEVRAALAHTAAERDEARAAVARAQAERDETLATYGTLAQARDQALNERSDALAARAEMSVEHDAALRARDEAVRLRDEAFAERDRALRELDAQRQAMQQLQAEREAEIAARGAAMVMRGAERAAPIQTDWTLRAIAIAVLVIALLAVLLIVRPV